MTAVLPRPTGALRAMAATCPSCFCSQPDGLLCWQCTQAVETMLTAAPYLVDQLDIAASKQAKISVGGKAGKGTAHLKEPVNWGAATARDELLMDVVTWARDVSNETWQPDEDEIVIVRAASVPWIGPFHDRCRHPSCERMRVTWIDKAPPIGHQAAVYLLKQVDAIRKHPAAAELAAGIGRAMKNGYQAIDRAADRQYLGQCLYEEGGLICHAEIWARPGAHQVTCTQCGITHEVGERRAWLLAQAADVICTVREASSYLGEIGHIQVTQAMIRGYLHRKRIAYRPGGTRIRLGDLLAVVVDESERRSA